MSLLLWLALAFVLWVLALVFLVRRLAWVADRDRETPRAPLPEPPAAYSSWRPHPAADRGMARETGALIQRHRFQGTIS